MPLSQAGLRPRSPIGLSCTFTASYQGPSAVLRQETFTTGWCAGVHLGAAGRPTQGLIADNM